MPTSKYFSQDDMNRVLQFIKDLEEDLNEAKTALKAGLIDQSVVDAIQKALDQQKAIRDAYK